jgi:uncharacterized protein (TIGR02996 family)
MNQEDTLLANIAAAPADHDLRLSYADWLEKQTGDRDRAEFIRAQCELARTPSHEPRYRLLIRLVRRLLARHLARWVSELGDLIAYNHDGSLGNAAFRGGWLDRLVLDCMENHHADRLARAQCARLLSDLTIRSLGRRVSRYHVHPAGAGEVFERLTDAATLRHLRSLSCGDPWYVGSSGDDGARHLPTFVAGLAHLETLRIEGFALDGNHFFALTNLGRLQELSLSGPFIEPLRLEVLAGNPHFGSLRDLSLAPTPGDSLAVAEHAPLEGLQKLLFSPHLPNLKSLTIHYSGLGWRGCTALIASGILSRLEVLDLRCCALDDAALRVLAASPGVAGLKALCLRDDDARGGRYANTFTAAGVRALRRAGFRKAV